MGQMSKPSGSRKKSVIITFIRQFVHDVIIGIAAFLLMTGEDYYIYKTGQPSYLRSRLSFPPSTRDLLSSFFTLSRPAFSSRLNIANISFFHSSPVLSTSQPFNLRRVAHQDTFSPASYSPVSDRSASLFFLSLTPIS